MLMLYYEEFIPNNIKSLYKITTSILNLRGVSCPRLVFEKRKAIEGSAFISIYIILNIILID
jgi:hypothetical protein